MLAQRPRFVLIAEAETAASAKWRFSLHGLDSNVTIAAGDEEPGAGPERLALLAVVRGLEALDGPSEVTIVTSSSVVSRGIRRGLPAWRNNHWRWERFGRLEPVRNADLWRRIDRAMAFHAVCCRSWRVDTPTAEREAIAAATHGHDREPHFTPLSVGEMPAMMVVPSKRARRTVSLAPRRAPIAAAG